MSDDEIDNEKTSEDYWEEVYEETMLHVKYLMETPREEAQRVIERTLADLKELREDSPKAFRFYFNRGRSLDELAYFQMYWFDREELQH